MHTLIIVGACVLSVFISVYFYLTRNFNYWTKRGVTGPTPTPFFGNFKDVLLQRTSPGNFLRDIYQSSPGLPYTGFFLIDRPALLVRDPSLIKTILVKDFSNFSDRYSSSSLIGDPLIGRSLLLLKGQKWKQSRNYIRPTFTSGRLKMMCPLVLQCGSELKKHLLELISPMSQTPQAPQSCDRSTTKVGHQRLLEVKELMAKSSTDVITTCAFGINSNCISDPNAEFREFGKAIFDFDFRRSLENMSVFFLPWFAKLIRVGFLPKKTTEFLRKVFWDTILIREESKTYRNDMIDLLILLKNKGTMDVEGQEREGNTNFNRNTKNQETFDFSGDDLVAPAASFYAAGFETSSSTLTFALYELAFALEIQARVRQEIREVTARHQGQISYDAIQEMKFLEMVILETLRKYPTLPFLDRICLEDYIVPGTGLKIEKGTPIFIPLLGLHYDPDIFPDPERFDPERFSDENKHSIPSCSYLPFGEGPRICIGMRFGLMAIKTQLANLLSSLEVLPGPTTPTRLEFSPQGTLLALKDGVSLIFRRMEGPA